MSLSSYLFERHQAVCHHMQERLATLRAAYWRSQPRRPVLCDPLEPRMMLSATQFLNATSYATGTNPQYVANADLNNDGNLDLIVANFSSNNISVFLGNGDGSFATAVNNSAGDGVAFVTAADLNDDGDMDLVVANVVDDTVSILLGNGDGTFATAVNYSTGDYPVYVATGDFDNDGDLDLAVGNNSSYNVTILLNDGDANFSLSNSYSAGSPIMSVIAEDLDKDGNLDLIMDNSFNNRIMVMMGNGDGTFDNGTTYATNGDFAKFIAAGDFDGDGNLDLVVSNRDSNNISILMGNGNGTFGAAVTYNTGYNKSVAVGDFNQDRKLDIAVVLSSGNQVRILEGNGDGTFAISALNYTVGNYPTSVTVGDFNNDGYLDLATANTSNSMSVLLNITDSTVVNSSKPYTYVDAGGNTVTVKLSGTGTAYVYGGGTTGSGENVSKIVLSGTTAKSTLTVTVTNSNSSVTNPSTSIGQIVLNNGAILGTLSASSVNLTGAGITGGATSYISTITIGNLSGGADIILAGTASKVSTTLNVKIVGDDSDITLGSAISSATFTSFGIGTITTTTIGTLTVNGNFLGDLDLTGNGKASTVVLTKFTLGGNASSVEWNFSGSVGTINVGGTLNVVTITAQGITTFTVGGNFNDSTITAKSITTLTVGGDFYGSTLSLGASTDMKGKTVLKTLTVTGLFSSGITADYGNAGTITAGAITGANLAFGNGGISKIETKGYTDFSSGSAIAGDFISMVTAQSITTWIVAGNFNAPLVYLGSPDMQNKTVLGSLTVTGSITGSIIGAVYGNAGTIKAAYIDASIDFANGSITKIETTGYYQSGGNNYSYSGNLTAKSVGTWIVAKDFAGTVNVQSLTTWTIGGGIVDTAVGDASAITLGSLSDMRNKTVLGTLTVAGSISGSNINAAYGNAGTIKAGSIDGSITFNTGAITTIETVKSANTDGNCSGFIRASSVGTWKVGGDLNASITLGANIDMKGKTALNAMTVKGSINNTLLDVLYGNLGTITVTGNIIDSSFYFINGTATKLDVAGNVITSQFTALSLGTGIIKGYINGTNIQLGISMDLLNKTVLGSLTVSQNMDSIYINANYGNIGKITAGSINGGTIGAQYGKVESLETTGYKDSIGTVFSGDITKGTESSFSLYAYSINTWTVTGSMSDVDVSVGFSSDMDNKVVIGTLTVSQDMSNVEIDALVGKATTIKAGRIQDCSFNFRNGNINRLETTGYKDANGNAVAGDQISGDIYAQSINTWVVKGDLLGIDVELYAANGVLALGTLTVGGTIGVYTYMDGGSEWHDNFYLAVYYGNIGTITAGCIASASISGPLSSISKLETTGYKDSGGSVIAGDQNDLDIYAKSINTWIVKGSLVNLYAEFSSYPTSGTMLNSLTVSGQMDNSYLQVDYGNVGTIKVGGIVNGSELIFQNSTVTKLEVTGYKDASGTAVAGLVDDSDIQAQSITTWTVKGNLTNTDVQLGAYRTSGNVLDTLDVSGAIENVNIQAYNGNARLIKAGSFNTNTFEFLNGRIASMESAGDYDGGSITAQSMGSWITNGNLGHVYVELGDSNTASGSAVNILLKTLSVAKQINELEIYAYGSLGDITAQSMINSTISLGYDSSSSTFTNSESIRNLTINGDKTTLATAFGGNTISAAQIQSLNIAYPGEGHTADSTFNTTYINSLQLTRVVNGKSKVLSALKGLTGSSTIDENGLLFAFSPIF